MAGETGTVESGLDTAAYNLAVYYALRPNVIFDAVATVRATRQSHRGASVTFTKMNDMAVSTTPLNEYVDVTAVALTDTPLTITLTEFGAATISTAKLRGTSFIEFDPTAANRLAYNAARTVDLLAQNALAASSNEQTSDSGYLDSEFVRKVYAQLQEDSVAPFADGFYRAFVTPHQAKDLRSESDEAGWRAPHIYGGNVERIYNGEIGVYEGFRFIVTPILIDGADVGSDPTRKAFFVGQEALAKAFSSAPGFGAYPTVRPGPVTDKLMRFRPMGWYWLGNYGVFREEAAVWADLLDQTTTPLS